MIHAMLGGSRARNSKLTMAKADHSEKDGKRKRSILELLIKKIQNQIKILFDEKYVLTCQFLLYFEPYHNKNILCLTYK